jgi:glycosyltransferase involved in cell wall biosynthesis
VQNRGKTIRESLDVICAHLRGRRPIGWELLVVDDGSGDDTYAQVITFSRSERRLVLLRNPSTMGIGCAARQGVLHARGDRILLAACGAPEPWNLLDSMEENLDAGFDLIAASPAVGASRPLPPVRIHTELLACLFPSRPGGERRGVAGREGHTFHLYTSQAAADIYQRQRIAGPGFGLEVLYLAQRYGYETLQIALPQGEPRRFPPSTPRGNTAGLKDLLRIRLHRLRGDYG